MKRTAGIAIIYDEKLLLTHPTNARWYETYSIPKGGIEKGEKVKAAAIRETYEEVGIKIKKSKLKGKPQIITYASGKKELHFFIYKIDSLSEIGLDNEKVPKSQLQLEEVDWAGFVSLKEATKRIGKGQVSLLGLMTESFITFDQFIK